MVWSLFSIKERGVGGDFRRMGVEKGRKIGEKENL